MLKNSKIRFNYSDYFMANRDDILLKHPGPDSRDDEISIRSKRFYYRGVDEIDRSNILHKYLTNCPYCYERLVTVVKDRAYPPYSSSSLADYLVKKCVECGWWFYDYNHRKYDENYYFWNYYEGILKKFDVSDGSVNFFPFGFIILICVSINVFLISSTLLFPSMVRK